MNLVPRFCSLSVQTTDFEIPQICDLRIIKYCSSMYFIHSSFSVIRLSFINYEVSAPQKCTGIVIFNIKFRKEALHERKNISEKF